MNPKYNLRYADGKWHDVKMCNTCGRIYSAWSIAHICEDCATYTSMGKNTRMAVKWKGIPMLPIGKFEIKHL